MPEKRSLAQVGMQMFAEVSRMHQANVHLQSLALAVKIAQHELDAQEIGECLLSSASDIANLVIAANFEHRRAQNTSEAPVVTEDVVRVIVETVFDLAYGLRELTLDQLLGVIQQINNEYAAVDGNVSNYILQIRLDSLIQSHLASDSPYRYRYDPDSD